MGRGKQFRVRNIAYVRDDATIANLCLTMIHQELFLLVRLIERAKSDFLQNGGIREEMSRARREYRERGNSGSCGDNGRNGSSGNNGNGGKPM